MNKDYDAGPRVRTNNFFDIGVVGRRTGITMKANVKKDADGLDNIDDFWDDSDDGGAADSNQNGTQDYTQDEYSGDEEEQEEQRVHPSPSVRRPDPRLYLQQEAPEELLLTPTSRRSRGASKGTLAGDSSLYGSHLYAGAEESPSIDKVRKRLVFTKNTSEDEEEQAPAPRTQFNKNTSVSPALDKILGESKQRKVNMAMSSGRDPSSKNTPFGSVSSSSAPKDKIPAKSAPPRAAPTKAAPPKSAISKPKQPITQPSKTLASARRPVGVPKAFNLGGDFDDQDDFTLPVYNSRSSLSDLEEDHAPPRTTVDKSKLKQKGRAVPARQVLGGDDDDGPIHDEPELRSGDDDRLVFSDEDRPNSYGNDESEESEVLKDNRKAPAQKKRAASTVEPVSALKGSKRTAGATQVAAKLRNIPKVDSGKNAQQKPRRREEEVDEEIGDVSSEDHREVPSMQRSKISSASKDKGKAKFGTTSGGIHKPREEKTTIHEIPIVPEEKPEEDAGVRRSSRTKVAPLEYWKNEKLVFEKAVDEGVAGQVIKAVLRAQPEEGETVRVKKTRGGKKRKFTPRSEIHAPPARRQRTGRGVGEKLSTQRSEAEDFVDDSMDEEQVELATKGVREEFRQSAETLVYGSDEVVKRVVAESQSSIQFRNVQSGEYQFHRGLEDADTVVSGTMKIKPDGRKPVNSGSNTSMVFYVIKGLVQVHVHETQFVLSAGGRFLVPRGNTYSIVNLSTKDSTLFFVQTKPPRADTAEISSSSGTTSTTTGNGNTQSTTENITKHNTLPKNATEDQAASDNLETKDPPPTEKKSHTAATSSKPLSPPPVITSSTNRRRSQSVRQSLSKTSAAAFVRSPSPPPSEVASNSNGLTAAAAAAIGVSRQPSVRPSVFR
ncbi:hypothetical protein EC991_009915 [Linnemannia zychae]|nr:hypothetical protein EC991_009915 [Linnemannia zychae]